MSVPAPDLAALGAHIREVRERAGVSIDRMAELAQIDRKTVMRTESGQHAASVRTLHAISFVLGVPVSELVRVLDETDSTTDLPGGTKS
ncbi:helix-turn-helix domain-containing protein [Brevibacterium luteolum]|uniref:helix-turn-helix domain-containing protein n=1 Tax=Brevibacterium luteolum TaxID=199591 RepID=UPI00223B97DF|nr:helix-turn-helix transcriptional regulator [Brevibacterium luteolum]MCT1921517.1 helix-turn-helix domain-containing protein [Brevibacterium luteolum]